MDEIFTATDEHPNGATRLLYRGKSPMDAYRKESMANRRFRLVVIRDGEETVIVDKRVTS